MKIHPLMQLAIAAAREAAKAILEVYAQPFGVELKADRSPLTLADRRAHEVIVAGLAESGLPVLSEEGAEISYETRKHWTSFWMVDPLDGTKEFVKRNGEFTVNIALIRDSIPVFGVIVVPVTGEVYAGGNGFGSFRYQVEESHNPEDWQTWRVDLPSIENNLFTVVASRSHRSPETDAYLAKLEKKHGTLHFISMGSSLKFCLVAEGKAAIYPRFAPTMEWDTAAGHAIVNGMGKEVIDYKTKAPMRYNKPNLLNAWFLVE